MPSAPSRVTGLSWWDGYQWVAIPGAPKFLIKTYTGMHGQAATAFQTEATALAQYGWRPDSVSMMQGDRKLIPAAAGLVIAALLGPTRHHADQIIVTYVRD